jgi:hypothetical protein
MDQRLDLDAHLTLSHDHRDVVVQAERNQVRVELPDLRTGMALMAQAHGYRARARWLEAVSRQLNAMNLTISVELTGRTLARFGTQARPGWLARRFDLGAIELRAIALTWAWLRSRWRN